MPSRGPNASPTYCGNVHCLSLLGSGDFEMIQDTHSIVWRKRQDATPPQRVERYPSVLREHTVPFHFLRSPARCLAASSAERTETYSARLATSSCKPSRRDASGFLDCFSDFVTRTSHVDGQSSRTILACVCMCRRQV